MKYAVLSDIHANPLALKRVLSDISEQKADQTICLGDVVGYGPDASEAIRLVRGELDVCLMGNHDAAVSAVVTCSGFSLPAVRGIRRHREETSVEERQWLADLKSVYEDGTIACAHGDFSNPPAFRYVSEPDDALPSFAVRSEQVLFVGHTHRMAVLRFDGNAVSREPVDGGEIAIAEGSRYLVNVGSVGYPRYDVCSTYCLYDSAEKKLRFRRVPFDYRAYEQALAKKDVELPRWFSDLKRQAARAQGSADAFSTSLWQKLKNLMR